MSQENDLEKLEDHVRKELAAVIGNLIDNKKGSTIKDIQPTEAIIRAMACAAAQVLMAFERGYRLGG